MRAEGASRLTIQLTKTNPNLKPYSPPQVDRTWGIWGPLGPAPSRFPLSSLTIWLVTTGGGWARAGKGGGEIGPENIVGATKAALVATGGCKGGEMGGGTKEQ